MEILIEYYVGNRNLEFVPQRDAIGLSGVPYTSFGVDARRSGQSISFNVHL